MMTYPLHSNRLLVTILISLAVDFECSSAQGVDSAAVDRFDTRVGGEPALPANDDVQRRGGLELGAAISAAYDSNIFLSRTNARADMVYQAGALVAYTQGDAKTGEGGFVKFAYRPNAVIYSKAASDSRLDHDAALVAGWRGKVSAVTYTGALRKLGGATADTGRQTDRIESANEIRGAWTPQEKVALQIAAGNRVSSYADKNLYDSREVYAEAVIRYIYSPKTAVSLAYRTGSLQVDGATDQTTQQLGTILEWQPREKIRVNLAAGAQRRSTGNGAEVNPVFAGRFDWDSGAGTDLYISGYRREEASAFLAGRNYTISGVTAGISQRLGGNWTARLEAGRESVDYKRVDGAGGGSREDRLWFVRPAFEYKFSDSVDLSIFYRMSRNNSTSANFGYGQRIAGAELRYKF